LSPMNAWIMLKGLETMPLRVAHAGATALRLAEFLGRHDKVESVLYPGLASHPQHALAKKQMSGGGTVLSFVVAGGKPGAFRFLNALKLVLISNNLGDSKSLAT